jgi:hypothetical protein
VPIQPRIQNTTAGTKTAKMVSTFSHSFPARLEAPLVCVGVAAVDVEAATGETVEVGVPKVLEALAVLWVSAAEEEKDVAMLDGTVLEVLAGPLELGLEGMKLGKVELEETELEERELEDELEGVGMELEGVKLEETVLDETPLGKTAVEDTAMDDIAVERVVLEGIVFEEGFIEDAMLEETVLGGIVLEGLILVETALVLALVAAEAAVLDDGVAPHFWTKL